MVLWFGISATLLADIPGESDNKSAIVKIYTIQNHPDYYTPWSMNSPVASTGSGCIISGRKILTNGHVVGNQTFLQVRRYGEARKYRARLISVSHDVDLAVLTVDDPGFFEGIEPIALNGLPEAQSEVLVYGFPLGGDTLSVTKGVVSRIEHQRYIHSSGYYLAAQMDAAINPGNSGGPVVMDGKLVGVVMQGIRQADNIGYMVPMPIIRHFLKDMQDGSYDGFPSLGVTLQSMENPDLKRYYKMPDDESGMLITHVIPGSPAEGHLEPGDILLGVDGYDVADDGTIEFRVKERTSMAYALQRHQVGDEAALRVLKQGAIKEFGVILDRGGPDDLLVPMEQYDRLPSYYIYGGLVFTPLTKNLLMSWGKNWFNAAPKHLVALLNDNYVEEGKDEVVVLLKVLASDSNEGYHGYGNWIVTKVNNQRIRNLGHMVEIIENSSSEPYVVFGNDRGERIILDRERLEDAADTILDHYRIAADRSPELVQP